MRLRFAMLNDSMTFLSFVRAIVDILMFFLIFILTVLHKAEKKGMNS